MAYSNDIVIAIYEIEQKLKETERLLEWLKNQVWEYNEKHNLND